MNNAKIGTALLGGYVLGRTKKAKLAISLGALLAGSRIKPGQVGKALQQSPFVHTLTDQVRSELTDAGKAAATTVLSAKADSLADALHERTAGLREKAQDQGERDTDRGEDTGGKDETETEADDEAETEPDEEPDEANGDGEEPRAKARGKAREKSGAEASRGAGRGKTQRGTSGRDEEQPRKRKTSTSQSRSRSGAARSRRQDDG
ncbi:ABC transporter substrate-binding protein [Streptomyces sp. HD]|uniref:ABC transporter substrate-binding protein n=1 Tax=Streptomyces sp. HD TaxID=3020892 RepID=UPI00232BF570|nr:ABC transporter substrate-binding protein [Streptomyces sp. HD]MDC0765523.1 ABC transporter substrate-binding protein [Streptomyces sp. HD]